MSEISNLLFLNVVLVFLCPTAVTIYVKVGLFVSATVFVTRVSSMLENLVFVSGDQRPVHLYFEYVNCPLLYRLTRFELIYNGNPHEVNEVKPTLTGYYSVVITANKTIDLQINATDNSVAGTYVLLSCTGAGLSRAAEFTWLGTSSSELF